MGMEVFARPADTWSGPTLMGRFLPGPIRNRVGYGFFLKKKKTEASPGRIWVLSKNPRPDSRLGPDKNPIP